MGSTNFTPPPLKWLTPPPEKNLVHMYDVDPYFWPQRNRCTIVHKWPNV
jgi:hypothetical protein